MIQYVRFYMWLAVNIIKICYLTYKMNIIHVCTICYILSLVKMTRPYTVISAIYQQKSLKN